MNFFAFDLRKMLIIASIIALPLLSINMQRNPGDEAWYKKPFSIMVGGLQTSYSVFTSAVRGTTSMYLNIVGVKKKNQLLDKENEELRANLGSLNELKLENERLTRLLDFRQSTPMKLIAARVIGRDISPDHYSLRIDRGLRDGIRKLQGVITVEGVVGYVFRPEEFSSQVIVLSDRSASIDAIVQRTRARGLTVGKSAGNCRLRYLERADDVAKDDLIITSGLAGYFPKGFPIGRITTVKKTEYGVSLEAQVAPVINPANLEEVFVVLNAGQEDFSNKNGNSDFGPPLLSKMMGFSPGTQRLDTSKIEPANKRPVSEKSLANEALKPTSVEDVESNEASDAREAR